MILLRQVACIVLAIIANLGCGEATSADYDEGDALGASAITGDLYHEEFERSTWSSQWSGSSKPTHVKSIASAR